MCRELTQERICVTPTTVGPFMCLLIELTWIMAQIKIKNKAICLFVVVNFVLPCIKLVKYDILWITSKDFCVKFHLVPYIYFKHDLPKSRHFYLLVNFCNIFAISPHNCMQFSPFCTVFIPLSFDIYNSISDIWYIIMWRDTFVFYPYALDCRTVVVVGHRNATKQSRTKKRQERGSVGCWSQLQDAGRQTRLWS
jgi:hypothetical protein